MTNLQALVSEWRRIAKAQMEGANDDDLEGLYSAAVDARVASRIYTRCADDLEKAGACSCKSANNPNGTTDAVIFTSETGKQYAVDACIAPVIAELHRLGMPTRASCCGHGIQPPSVIMETDMDHYDCLQLLKRIDPRLWSVERVRP